MLWRYKFSQLKGSSDDGKSKIKFLFQNPDTKLIEAKVTDAALISQIIHLGKLELSREQLRLRRRELELISDVNESCVLWINGKDVFSEEFLGSVTSCLFVFFVFFCRINFWREREKEKLVRERVLFRALTETCLVEVFFQLMGFVDNKNECCKGTKNIALV